MNSRTVLGLLFICMVVLLLDGKVSACVVCFPSCGTVDCGKVDCAHCNQACICTGPQRSAYLQEPHPGMFTSQLLGNDVVTAVIPGSPADQAGILVGDVVAKRSHVKPGTTCRAATWYDTAESGQIQLDIARGGTTHRVTVALRPLGQIMARAYGLRTVSRTSSAEVLEGPFTYGMQLVRRGQHLVIDHVVDGSPADVSGARVGDRIIAADGTIIGESTAGELTAATYRKAIQLTVERQGRRFDVRVKAEGLSELLRRLGPREDRRLVASR